MGLPTGKGGKYMAKKNSSRTRRSYVEYSLAQTARVVITLTTDYISPGKIKTARKGTVHLTAHADDSG